MELRFVLSKQKVMKVYCKTCNLPLTNEVKLYEGKSFGKADKQPFIQAGFYTVSDDGFFSDTKGDIIINVGDMINTIDHTDEERLTGCCGLAGLDGANKMCVNGHEVATEKSDCWMPRAVIFEKEKTILK